jgi:hypothetical protein
MEKPESAGSVVPSCGRTTDVTAKLLNDYDANEKTFKVHLDGYE